MNYANFLFEEYFGYFQTKRNYSYEQQIICVTLQYFLNHDTVHEKNKSDAIKQNVYNTHEA